MGQKINSNLFRLGIFRTWESQWSGDFFEYGIFLNQDYQIRNFIKNIFFNLLCPTTEFRIKRFISGKIWIEGLIYVSLDQSYIFLNQLGFYFRYLIFFKRKWNNLKYPIYFKNYVNIYFYKSLISTVFSYFLQELILLQRYFFFFRTYWYSHYINSFNLYFRTRKINSYFNNDLFKHSLFSFFFKIGFFWYSSCNYYILNKFSFIFSLLKKKNVFFFFRSFLSFGSIFSFFFSFFDYYHSSFNLIRINSFFYYFFLLRFNLFFFNYFEKPIYYFFYCQLIKKFLKNKQKYLFLIKKFKNVFFNSIHSNNFFNLKIIKFIINFVYIKKKLINVNVNMNNIFIKKNVNLFLLKKFDNSLFEKLIQLKKNSKIFFFVNFLMFILFKRYLIFILKKYLFKKLFCLIKNKNVIYDKDIIYDFFLSIIIKYFNKKKCIFKQLFISKYYSLFKKKLLLKNLYNQHFSLKNFKFFLKSTLHLHYNNFFYKKKKLKNLFLFLKKSFFKLLFFKATFVFYFSLIKQNVFYLILPFFINFSNSFFNFFKKSIIFDLFFQLKFFKILKIFLFIKYMLYYLKFKMKRKVFLSSLIDRSINKIFLYKLFFNSIYNHTNIKNFFFNFYNYAFYSFFFKVIFSKFKKKFFFNKKKRMVKSFIFLKNRIYLFNFVESRIINSLHFLNIFNVSYNFNVDINSLHFLSYIRSYYLFFHFHFFFYKNLQRYLFFINKKQNKHFIRLVNYIKNKRNFIMNYIPPFIKKSTIYYHYRYQYMNAIKLFKKYKKSHYNLLDFIKHNHKFIQQNHKLIPFFIFLVILFKRNNISSNYFKSLKNANIEKYKHLSLINEDKFIKDIEGFKDKKNVFLLSDSFWDSIYHYSDMFKKFEEKYKYKNSNIIKKFKKKKDSEFKLKFKKEYKISDIFKYLNDLYYKTNNKGKNYYSDNNNLYYKRKIINFNYKGSNIKINTNKYDIEKDIIFFFKIFKNNKYLVSKYNIYTNSRRLNLKKKKIKSQYFKFIINKNKVKKFKKRKRYKFLLNKYYNLYKILFKKFYNIYFKKKSIRYYYYLKKLKCFLKKHFKSIIITKINYNNFQLNYSSFIHIFILFFKYMNLQLKKKINFNNKFLKRIFRFYVIYIYLNYFSKFKYQHNFGNYFKNNYNLFNIYWNRRSLNKKKKTLKRKISNSKKILNSNKFFYHYINRYKRYEKTFKTVNEILEDQIMIEPNFDELYHIIKDELNKKYHFNMFFSFLFDIQLDKETIPISIVNQFSLKIEYSISLFIKGLAFFLPYFYFYKLPKLSSSFMLCQFIVFEMESGLSYFEVIKKIKHWNSSIVYSNKKRYFEDQEPNVLFFNYIISQLLNLKIKSYVQLEYDLTNTFLYHIEKLKKFLIFYVNSYVQNISNYNFKFFLNKSLNFFFKLRFKHLNLKIVFLIINLLKNIERKIIFPLNNYVEETVISYRGLKIKCSGRFNKRNPRARIMFYQRGHIPFSTLSNYVDYAQMAAITYLGSIGIQVWIYLSEMSFL